MVGLWQRSYNLKLTHFKEDILNALSDKNEKITQLLQQLSLQGQGHPFAAAPNSVMSKATSCVPANKYLKSKEWSIEKCPMLFRATVTI